jgi:hypothetical protein
MRDLGAALGLALAIEGLLMTGFADAMGADAWRRPRARSSPTPLGLMACLQHWST